MYKDLEKRVLLIANKKLTDLYLAIEALKDDMQNFGKTPTQKALWECLDILGKVETEISKENNK